MSVTRLFFLSAFAAALWAQPGTHTGSITAQGTASVSVMPDLARVDVSVFTQASTAEDASNQNATLTTAVINALQSLLGSSATITTVGYSLSPVYNNPPAGQNATIVGYQVTNTVEIKLTDLTKIGQTIDTAIQSGANRVQGISFDLQNRNSATSQALKMAAVNAQTQANAIATGLNLHTGAVLQAGEGLNVANPVVGVAAPSAGTPVEPGLVVVQATVTLVVAIAP